MEKYLSGLKPTCRVSAMCSIRAVIEILSPGTNPSEFSWHSLRRADVERIYETYASNRCKRDPLLSITRGILRECRALGLIETTAYADAVRHRPPKPLPSFRRKRGRPSLNVSNDDNEELGTPERFDIIGTEELQDVVRSLGVL